MVSRCKEAKRKEMTMPIVYIAIFAFLVYGLALNPLPTLILLVLLGLGGNVDDV